LKKGISPYYSSWQKRIFDCYVALLGLILLWPLFLLVSAAVFLSSGWPIFFFQKRMGIQKKHFLLIKFRTMLPNAEKKRSSLLKKNEAPWPMFKLQRDPRYTKIGKFLSRTGIDELPQLINILKGEMSVVGPRPLPIYEAEKLPTSWNFRYQVKPGIISEWVVSSSRYVSLAAWKKLELKTLQQGSWEYDFDLMLRTAAYLLRLF
jgi:lipopolysaccharide/colanic/teichoic acid biosynthesis glycosyltransferase